MHAIFPSNIPTFNGNGNVFMAEDSNRKTILGVNVGGWLVLERYITPSIFALNKCHLQGDLCWYPGTIGDHSKLCSKSCTDHPVMVKNVFGATDYPLDEWNLAEIFHNYSTAEIGEEWLNVHFDKFVTYEDLERVKASGITHIRVPLPHWVLQDHPSAQSSSEFKAIYDSLRKEEPFLVGNRWKYFVRLCHWARDIGLEVWPNLHTAPGSQNSFDNSGHQGANKTCDGWMNDTLTEGSFVNNTNYPSNVYKSLKIIDHVTRQMAEDGIDDVISGFGLLNEPYIDCNLTIYERFVDDGLAMVRKNLGNENVGVFVSDMFWAPQFSDGSWWLDSENYKNTYLDSHYYNVFTDDERRMAPEKHIDHVCNAPQGKGLAIDDCCFKNPHLSNSTQPSEGVQRIVTEWSVAYDSMPGELLKIILQSFQERGHAPENKRVLSDDRKSFMKQYAQAQMVSFERAGGQGWFFWSLKMENVAYFEWDFLRALDLGWFPEIAKPTQSSEELYGSCDSISKNVAALNASEVVHVYPWGDEASYRYWDPTGLGWEFDHEQEEMRESNITNTTLGMNFTNTSLKVSPAALHGGSGWPKEHRQPAIVWIILLLFAAAISYFARKIQSKISQRSNYEPIKDDKNPETGGGMKGVELNV